jgi:hypothetical protein
MGQPLIPYTASASTICVCQPAETFYQVSCQGGKMQRQHDTGAPEGFPSSAGHWAEQLEL